MESPRLRLKNYISVCLSSVQACVTSQFSDKFPPSAMIVMVKNNKFVLLAVTSDSSHPTGPLTSQSGAD